VAQVKHSRPAVALHTGTNRDIIKMSHHHQSKTENGKRCTFTAQG
jgi:hypothetical protein